MRILHPINNALRIDAIFQSLERVLSKEHDFPGESHNFWEAVYVNDGEVEVAEEGNVYVLSKGDIIFHAPMEFHRIRSAGDSTPHVFNLSFCTSGKYPKELLAGVFHLDGVERKEFLSICKSAVVFAEEETEEEFFGQEIAVRLLGFMFRLSRTNQAEQKRVSTERVLLYKRLMQIMSEEVYNNISVSEVADRMFVSVSYVKVLFKRYAGVSPKNYYTNLQINEACKMLEKGKTVREIAEQMSFSTPSYFSVFFKKHVGMTPKQYKNKMK